MKKIYSLTFLLIVSLLTTFAQEFKPDAAFYGIGFWTPDTLGNHRAVIRVDSSNDLIKAVIPWRRRDKAPAETGLLIFNAQTGERVTNLLRNSISSESGEIIFDGSKGVGDYFVYYLPYQTSGGPYPKIKYIKEDLSPDQSWLVKAQKADPKSLPTARFKQFQSLSSFDSFYPMEIAATSSEKQTLIADNSNRPFILFPEKREFPIRMFDEIPYRWAAQGASNSISLEADMNEYFVFQLGLWAAKSNVEDVKVTFSDLKGAQNTIPASAMTCFNTQGQDWLKREMKIKLDVKKDAVQPLWIGIDIPKDQIQSGIYKGSVTVSASGMQPQTVDMIMNLSDRVLTDRGDGDIYRLSRLRWLNSDFAFDNKIVKPFTPVELKGDRISILGRDVTIDKYGLPGSITSYFTQEMTSVAGTAKRVINSPIELIVEQNKKKTELQNSSFRFTSQDQGIVEWESINKAGTLDIKIDGSIEFDGFMEYKVTVTATQESSIDDISLLVPISDKSAKYWLGLGAEGSLRPVKGQWKWDVQRNQEGYWFGDVNAGIQCLFRDENYVRPLNTNFYHQKPLNLPPSWYNNGLGGISFAEKNGTLNVKTYSGKRTLKKGETLHFNFLISVTPFKPIDTKKQWKDRYIHSYIEPEKAIESGTNVINIHHANPINPFINYPFIRPDFMKQYVDNAHQVGAKVKIYYTVRELANRAPELFALRSLGGEIFSPGDIGGYSWLREHLGQDYIAAWFVDKYKDAAVVNSGVSRWHNYYVEGLAWLVENIGIDGLYIDDLAIDRTTMKRVRKILERNRPEPRIDLHSANQFNAKDGFINSSFLYMEHMPYLDRLWFGEYFKYEKAPDYWMTEVSGIPFGMMGEMLQDDGNPWRGMLYGMTARYGYHGPDKQVPKLFWTVWDDFGIQDSRMIGYWVDENPVTTTNKDVLATTFVKDGKTMIALASWAPNDVEVKLNIDWKKLNLDPTKAKLYFPQMGNIQNKSTMAADGTIKVAKESGSLIILGDI